jgi:hypothetical protein
MSDSMPQETPAKPVVNAPEQAVVPDQVNDDTPGVDDSAPSENPEDNES